MEVPEIENVYVNKKIECVREKYVDVPEDVYVDKEIIEEIEIPIEKPVYYDKIVEVPVTKVVDVPEIKRIKKSVVV